MAGLLNLENTLQVLESYAVEFRNMYQDNLIRSDRIASGELLNSVKARVEARGTVYEVQLLLEDYWKSGRIRARSYAAVTGVSHQPQDSEVRDPREP